MEDTYAELSPDLDFFVSHAGADRPWAEWVAWQLVEAGYSVELDVWDWAAGENVVDKISEALRRAERVVALFSPAYFERGRFTVEEWTAVVAAGKDRGAGRLIPVRIERMPLSQVPDVLRPLLVRDLFELDEESARRVLLEAVAGPKRPRTNPGFPGGSGGRSPERLGGSGPRLPGMLPRVWEMPARNAAFTGRGGMLVRIREALLSGTPPVAVLRGEGGRGKSQLCIEYGHRFAGDYEAVWWVDAEQPDLIAQQMAQMGVAMGAADRSADTMAGARAAVAELRRRERWLLIFDNVQEFGHVVPWLPGGRGHVLITARAGVWDEVGAVVPVDVFERVESVQLLRDRVAALSERDADRLAEELGDLPLGVAQAAATLRESGIPAREYLDELRTNAAEVMERGRPPSYPVSLAASLRLGLDRLAARDARAAALVRLCAFLAPEPVPAEWFHQPDNAPLRELVGDLTDTRWRVRDAFALVERYGLARTDQDGLRLHRLTQAVLRDQCPAEQEGPIEAAVVALLAEAEPDDPDDPGNWPAWARFTPHVLVTDPARSPHAALRRAGYSTARYLVSSGQFRAGLAFASGLYEGWLATLGEDHEDTREAAAALAYAYQQMGDFARARPLNESILAWARRVRGEDHPDTLRTANNLAVDLYGLGEVVRARELDEDVLARRRRVLGEDHPDTLLTACNLAVDLYGLGEAVRARELKEDVLARQRRVLGEDHPDTLSTAHNLAVDLYGLGEVVRARELKEDVLVRRRRVLGEDHPDTLSTAHNLAIDLYALGEVERARKLNKDTLARQRRVLGEDHPDTLRTARFLADRLTEDDAG